MNHWDARSFIEGCLPEFYGVTMEFEGYGNLGRDTRLLAYAQWGFIETAGEDAWSPKIERDLFELIGRELSADAMFPEAWKSVSAFASYVYGALDGKRHRGELDEKQLLSAHLQLVDFDYANIDKICEVYEGALADVE